MVDVSKSVLGSGYTWDEWTFTMPSRHDAYIDIGNDSVGVDVDKLLIDEEYPGFTHVFETLWAHELDAENITKLLKFCMMQRPLTVLEVFERPLFMQTVKHAVALGLDADCVITTLSLSDRPTPSVELPTTQLFT